MTEVLEREPIHCANCARPTGDFGPVGETQRLTHYCDGCRNLAAPYRYDYEGEVTWNGVRQHREGEEGDRYEFDENLAALQRLNRALEMPGRAGDPPIITTTGYIFAAGNNVIQQPVFQDPDEIFAGAGNEPLPGRVNDPPPLEPRCPCGSTEFRAYGTANVTYETWIDDGTIYVDHYAIDDREPLDTHVECNECGLQQPNWEVG